MLVAFSRGGGEVCYHFRLETYFNWCNFNICFYFNILMRCNLTSKLPLLFLHLYYLCLRWLVCLHYTYLTPWQPLLFLLCIVHIPLMQFLELLEVRPWLQFNVKIWFCSLFNLLLPPLSNFCLVSSVIRNMVVYGCSLEQI